VTDAFLWYVGAGFLAQLVDGSLGMAYGVTASTMLLSLGVPPAAASATVHAAECLTTGASGLSHHVFGNVDKQLFKRLLIPGVIGAVLGAYVLVSLPGEELRPWVASYLLLMGAFIIVKAFRMLQPKVITTHVAPLGFVGAFVDAIGGGGWGPVVATTLVARGNGLRRTVGTVNAVEFFVTLAASVTFVLTLGVTHWQMIIGLAVGGLGAAPLAAWATKRIPVRPFMILIGLLVIALSIRTLVRYFGG
jgi:uncharacterized membrane protein YfcA